MTTSQIHNRATCGRTVPSGGLWLALARRLSLFFGHRAKTVNHSSSVHLAAPEAAAQPGCSANGEKTPCSGAAIGEWTAAREQPAARPEKFRREVEIGFPLQYQQVIQQARLARAEAAIVKLGLPLLPRWRRRVRSVYTPGYLTALNPKLIKSA